jgi:hypothetical protein
MANQAGLVIDTVEKAGYKKIENILMKHMALYRMDIP